MNTETINTPDPKVHALNLEQMLTGIIDHLRRDLKIVTDPAGRILLETSSDVLTGLRSAFHRFAAGQP